MHAQFVTGDRDAGRMVQLPANCWSVLRGVGAEDGYDGACLKPAAVRRLLWSATVTTAVHAPAKAVDDLDH